MLRKAILVILALVAVAVVAGWWNRAAVKRFSYEGTDRDAWQQPDRVLRELQVGPGQRVADIGSGGGYFTFRLARAVGADGKVYAVDVDKDMTEYIARQAAELGLGNVETILAATNDPQIPAPVDLVFVCNTYHHLRNRADYFRRVQGYLSPGGRVAIIELSSQSNWFVRTFGHFTGAEAIRAEMEAAGYRLAEEHDFLEQQHFLVFARAEESSP